MFLSHLVQLALLNLLLKKNVNNISTYCTIGHVKYFTGKLFLSKKLLTNLYYFYILHDRYLFVSLFINHCSFFLIPPPNNLSLLYYVFILSDEPLFSLPFRLIDIYILILIWIFTSCINLHKLQYLLQGCRETTQVYLSKDIKLCFFLFFFFSPHPTGIKNYQPSCTEFPAKHTLGGDCVHFYDEEEQECDDSDGWWCKFPPIEFDTFIPHCLSNKKSLSDFLQSKAGSFMLPLRDKGYFFD